MLIHTLINTIHVGANHPDTIRSLCCLAEISHNLNRFQEAANSYDMASKAIAHLHQSDDTRTHAHAHTLFSDEMLNALYFKQACCLYSYGNSKHAARLWKQCYFGLTNHLRGNKHTHINNDNDDNENSNTTTTNNNNNNNNKGSSSKSKSKKERRKSKRSMFSKDGSDDGVHPIARQCRNNLVGLQGTHTYLHTYIHTYIHTYMYSYIHICAHKYIHSICVS